MCGMNQLHWARRIRASGSLLAAVWVGLFLGLRAKAADIRVLVWDERQPRQKEAYSNWLGNEIAAHLRKVPGLKVTSSALDDPAQGLGELDRTDVLVWWGHVRQMEIEPPVARDIVRRIREGRLQLIALHQLPHGCNAGEFDRGCRNALLTGPDIHAQWCRDHNNAHAAKNGKLRTQPKIFQALRHVCNRKIHFQFLSLRNGYRK